MAKKANGDDGGPRYRGQIPDRAAGGQPDRGSREARRAKERARLNQESGSYRRNKR